MVMHSLNPSEAAETPSSSLPWRGGWRSRHVWVLVAVVVTVAGLLGSVAAARSVARDDSGKSQKSFELASGSGGFDAAAGDPA